MSIEANLSAQVEEAVRGQINTGLREHRAKSERIRKDIADGGSSASYLERLAEVIADEEVDNRLIYALDKVDFNGADLREELVKLRTKTLAAILRHKPHNSTSAGSNLVDHYKLTAFQSMYGYLDGWILVLDAR